MDEIEYPALNHTETTDDDSLEAIVSVVVPILFSLIGIIGFIGNILVIITVLFNQQMRNTTNLLILNLSLADLLFVCFCIPATVSIENTSQFSYCLRSYFIITLLKIKILQAVDYTLSTWPFSEFWCKTVQYLITCTAYISIYTLVLMSFDRFIGECNFFLQQNLKKFQKFLI